MWWVVSEDMWKVVAEDMWWLVAEDMWKVVAEDMWWPRSDDIAKLSRAGAAAWLSNNKDESRLTSSQ